MNEKVLSNKAERFACYPMCLQCFNNNAEQMTYSKNKLLKHGKKVVLFWKKERWNETKQEINKRKYNSISEGETLKVPKGVEVIEEIQTS